MQQLDELGLPVRAALHSSGLYLALRQIRSEELQDAFMQQTVARVLSQDRIVHVERDRLGWAPPHTAPVGIILHVARCGSTLISQSLKRLGDVVVYAEPQPVNEILAPPHRWPRDDLIAALRTLSVAFARHAGRPYVLKLSSWNTLYCDIVAAAFPQTPWVFSVRDPIEVGVSLLANPPGWFQEATLESRELIARVDPEHASSSREQFVARTYGAFCAAAAALESGRGRLIPYDRLPAAIWDDVAPHFSLTVDAAQRDRIVEAARRHAKAAISTNAEFKSDAAAKQDAASPELRLAVDALARPQLERLMRLHADTMRG